MLRITDRAYGGDSGGAGSQAVAAGFRHAMSTPRIPSSRSEEKVSATSTHAEIPIAKLDRMD